MKKIILLLLIIFSLTIEAQQMMGPPPGECNFKGENGMTTIPFELVNNHMIIKADLNGENQIRLVLDTGFPAHGALLYETKQIKELNLNYSGRAMVGGANGELRPANLMMDASLSLPEIEFTGIDVIVMPHDEVSARRFRHTDGTIGYSIFSRFVVEFDFEKNLLTLTKPETFQDTGQYKEYKVTLVKNIPVITATPTLENGTSKPLPMVIDLGATHAFSLDEQKKLNILPPKNNLRTKAVGASGEFEIIRGRVPDFKLGDFRFENVLASFNGEEIKMHPGSDIKGNLGMDILRRFQLIIDYNGSRIFLKPNKYFKQPFETNMSGFRYYWNDNNQVVVEDIYENSAATESDIKLGDQILQIDGKPIEKYSINDLNMVFRQEGKTLKLTILRDGKEITKKLKLKRLI